MQEIIVYRNPGEAAIWHALSENPGTIFIFSGVMLVAFLILWFGLTAITGRGNFSKGGNWIVPVCLFGSFLSACVAVWFWA